MAVSYPIKFPVLAAWAAANRFGLLGTPKVGSHPKLDAKALGRWRSRIAEGGVYLEYGSGGSTIEAVQTASAVISVETDKRYLNAVEQRVTETSANPARFHPIHVDIGWTELWGQPLIWVRSKRRVSRWRRYSSAPWELLTAERLVPNFILVDGRFRVASVLESCLQLPDTADCLFMLDDFEVREQRYRVIMDFVSQVERVGRAVLFRRADNFRREDCARLLERYQADPE
jgi:hypothetical protein